MARENSGNRQRARRARRTPAVIGVLSVIAFAGAGVAARAGEECVPEWDSQSPIVPANATNGPVYSMVYFDEGTGERLFLAGLIAANTPSGLAWAIVRWDGGSLTKVGEGISFLGRGSALAVYADAGDSSLFLGGAFTTAGGSAASNIARWDGQQWHAVGSGTNGRVDALAAYDDGTGEQLYAAGPFSMAGGVPASAIARWNGTAWSPVGGGFAAQQGMPFPKALVEHELPDGRRLLFASGVHSAGGVIVRGLAAWDGQKWSLPPGWVVGNAHALFSADLFGQSCLYVGGWAMEAGAESGQQILAWDGASWSALGKGLTGSGGGIEGVVGLASFNDGSGDRIVASGYFTHADGILVGHIAKWDGKAWHPLGGGLSPSGGLTWARALIEDRFYSSSPALLVGGQFDHAGGYDLENLARYLGCFAPCPADLSGDREINTDDLNILLSGFGCTGDPGACPGDIDEDGDTDSTDLNIVLSVFGTSCPN